MAWGLLADVSSSGLQLKVARWHQPLAPAAGTLSLLMHGRSGLAVDAAVLCLVTHALQGGLGWLTSWENGAPQLGWAATGAYLVLPILLIVSQVSSLRCDVLCLAVLCCAVYRLPGVPWGSTAGAKVLLHRPTSALLPLCLSTALSATPCLLLLCSTSPRRPFLRPRATTRSSSRRRQSSSSCPS